MQRGIYESLEKAIHFDDPSYGKLMFIQGLISAIGFGVKIDFSKTMTLILESAKAGYRPAKYTYRRLHQALLTLRPHRANEGPSYPANALQEVDPDLHNSLVEIEQSHPNDYLPYACRLSEKEAWRERVLRTCPKAMTLFVERVILNSSKVEILKDLRSEVLELSHEAWNAHQTDRAYPVDYLLALAIVIDDTDSDFFRQIAEPFARKLEKWDLHMSGFAAPISPLLLAARVGNTGAVRYLTQHGASPAYKSYLGLVPLHFLFIFDDANTSEMAALLSAKLSLTDPYYAEESYIPEQMCTLVGTPLAFSTQVNHCKSIDALNAMDSSTQVSYSLRYQFGPQLFLPGVSDPMIGWHGLGHIFDLLAHLQTTSDATTEQMMLLDHAFSKPESILDLTIMIIVVLRAWHMHRMSHWVMHGNHYQSRLETTLQAIAEVETTQNRVWSSDQIHKVLELCSLVVSSFRNENLLYVLGTHLRAVMDPHDFDTRFVPLLAAQIEESMFKEPYMHTMIGLFPRRFPTPEEMHSDLLLSYRCHDSVAFTRILSNAFAYSIDNQVEFILHFTAISPSHDVSIFIESLNRYSTAEQIPPDMINAAVQLAVRHGNNDALEAYFKVFGVSCFIDQNGANIFHLLSTNDCFDALLSEMAVYLGVNITRRFLNSRERIGGFRPIQVALHSGSCKCIRTLLRHYALKEAEFSNMADTLFEFNSTFNITLFNLMHHFTFETWYSKWFLRWFTGLYPVAESRAQRAYAVSAWNVQSSAALLQLSNCITQMQGIEQDRQMLANQHLKEEL